MQGLTYESERPSIVDGWVCLGRRASEDRPKVDVANIHVLDAVELVGRVEFGDEWTGDELNVLIWPIQPVSIYRVFVATRLNAEKNKQYREPLPRSLADNASYGKHETKDEFEARKTKTIDAILVEKAQIPVHIQDEQRDWEINNAALVRLRVVAGWLGGQCRDGVVVGHYRMKGGQEPFVLRAVDWNCSDEFSGWLATGGRKMYFQSGGKLFDCDFFLDRASLQNATASLAHAPLLIDRADLTRLAPDLQLAVRIALQLKLFEPNVMLAGKVEAAVIAAGKAAGREIKNTKAKQMSDTMRWPISPIKTSGPKKT